MYMQKLGTVFLIFAMLGGLAAAQSRNADQDKTRPDHPDTVTAAKKTAAPAEDISGMYSFLREGEFVQINLEQNTVSGYISRRGDLESDKGAFLDQFFSNASIQGHDISFTTRPLHGVIYEFKGRFERGPVKSKAQDGYYVLRGTLKEMVSDAGNKTTARSREVVFKLLAEPPEAAERGKEKD